MDDTNKMSMFTAILVSINIMIGIGIYLMPSYMAQQSGSLSFLGWGLVALIFLPVVYSVAQLTKLFDGVGSFFSYANHSLGKAAGFISGWSYFLGFSATSAMLFLFLRDFLPQQFNITVFNDHPILFNVIFISIFCLLNLLSLKYISKIQNVVTIIKLMPLLFVISLIFFYFNTNNVTLGLQNISTLKLTIPLALFGFWGFESACGISHLIKGDKNTPSKVILISFLATALIYTLFHLSLLLIMSPENLITYKSYGFTNFLNIKSEFLRRISSSFISSAILISLLNSIFGILLTNSSNLQSMIDNNLFPMSGKLKKLNKNDRPKYVILLTGLTAFIMVTLTSNTIILNSLCNMGLITTFTLLLISLLLIQRKRNLKWEIVPTILGFGSLAIATYYSWIKIGSTTTERLLYLSPLMIFELIGIALFKMNMRKNK